MFRYFALMKYVEKLSKFAKMFIFLLVSRDYIKYGLEKSTARVIIQRGLMLFSHFRVNMHFILAF